MNLIAVRHGIAEEREEFAKKGKEDHLRPLTPKGRKRAVKIAAKLRSWVPNVDLIVTSPYTRARETADILGTVFTEAELIEAPELVPQSPPQAFLNWLKAHARNKRNIMMVGHEPHMTSFITFLISAQNQPILELKKSGVACLEFESFQNLSAGGARLNWLVQPRLIED